MVNDEPTTDARVPGDEATITLACAQIEPRVGEVEHNRARTVEAIEDAVERGADFVILPELANSGYVFDSRSEARACAEPIPSGETARRWKELAVEHGVYVVGGYAELDGADVYNSSVFVGPDGFIGAQRKLHLWNEEKLWFEPGEEIRVFKTPVGRVGIQICYDQWFPEMSRIQAQQGADLIVEPTNWVPTTEREQAGELGEDELARANHLAVSNAHVNTVWFACADRVGVERGSEFLGRSLILDPDGEPVAGPASRNEEEIVLAECNLADARRKKTWNDYNGVPSDRRTDVYGEMLGYDADAHPF
ncbi:MAG: nitrilase family protein [Halapricum sp.]